MKAAHLCQLPRELKEHDLRLASSSVTTGIQVFNIF